MGGGGDKRQRWNKEMVKHPNLKLAAGCLLAASFSLLSACGGGSSSSAGGADSRSYQQGVAHGTATTLELVLDDLVQLQMSLAGSGAPAQTSLGTLGRSFARLEPRQRAALADELNTFIARVRTAQAAAAAAGAGTAEAEAAQQAADEALRALRLVVAADTAARVGGGEAAQMAAIDALTRIAEVEPDAPDAQDQINAALDAALAAAQTEVATLQQALEDARRELGEQAGSSAELIAGLNRRISSLQTSLSAAEASLNALNAEFGAPPSTAALRQAPPPTAGIRHHPHGKTTIFDVTPDPVVYDPDGSNARVFAPSGRNPSLFPGRGVVFRGNLRRVHPGATPEAAGTPSTWVYADQHRLVRQDHDPDPATSGSSNPSGQNWEPAVNMAFQYQAEGGFTMFFGDAGDGANFNDMQPHIVRKSDGVAQPSGGTRNLEISFLSPEADPFRTPHTNYWLMNVPALVTQASLEAQNLADTWEPVSDKGRYEMLLSAYAGIDDKGTESTADDAERRRLSYAAYGLFQFVDHLLASPRVGRVQIFHYGVDAFSDDDNRGVEDLTGNDTIEGTFRGRTMGWMLTSLDKTAARSFIKDMYRLRGDVELRACIGGAACGFDAADNTDDLTAGQITGTITNLEVAYANRAHDLYWTQNPLHGVDLRQREVMLLPGTIVDNGTYSGNVNSGSSDDRGGGYEGAFYGPRGALETAGTWWMAAPDWAVASWDGLVGSFGAVCAEGCAPAAP